MFTPHHLTPHHAYALPRETSYNILLFLLLTASCTLLLFVYLLYFKKTLQLVQGVFSYTSSKQLQREGYSFFKFFSLALTAVYIICVSIFFTDLNERMKWVSLPNKNFLLPASILFLVFLLAVKRMSPLFFSFFLRNQKALNDYFFQYSFSIKTEGLLLFPVCLLLHYSTIPQEYLLPLGLFIPLVIFSVRVVRTVIWGRAEYGFSLFHILLYLCTVEIIPLVVFIKVLVAGWLCFS